MKLTKQLRSEILDVYEAFWGSLFQVDIEIYSRVLDNNYRLIGTTDKEVFFNKKDAVSFLKATADQLAGNIERRNSKIKIEVVDNLILITEQFDAYVLIENDWTFYGRTRVSTWMQQKPNGWKIVQQHFSLPDAKAEEGQTIGLEKISKENLELRDAIKRRTIELEHKNRKLEIEAALERVRSRTMAMHRSEEIADIVGKIFTELKLLDLVLNRVLIWIFNDDEKYISWWSANPEAESNAESYRIDYNEQPVFLSYLQAWQKRVPLYLYTLSGDNKKNWEDHLFSNTGLSKLPLEVRKGMREEGTIFTTSTISDYGLMMVGSFEPLSAENTDIIQRFGRVFQQSFIRYLDVQKAEAQAREAQIQLALERVRARTMAMHQSDELREVVQLLFEQIKNLGFDASMCSIALQDKATKGYQVIASSHARAVFPQIYNVPYFEDAFLNKFMAAFNEGVTYKVFELGGIEKKELDKKYFTLTDFRFVPEQTKQLMMNTERCSQCCAYMKYGCITAIGDQELGVEQAEILQRFAKVFEQTYTRFLDLQKAEAQAREAQIEAALERVRSRSLAMHHSDELREIIGMVYMMLSELKVKHDTTAIQVFDFDTKSAVLWPRNTLQKFAPKVVFPYNKSIMKEDTPHRYLWEAMATGEPIINKVFTKQQKDRWFEYIFAHNDYTVVEEHSRQFLLKLENLTVCFFPEKYSGLYAESWDGTKYSEEDIDVLKRAARVFEQAYVRFLDLQKAEAQAREAQVETALEKVRSRSLAMHRSDELEQVVVSLFNRLVELGLTFNGAGIYLFDKEKKGMHLWVASKVADPVKVELPNNTEIANNQINKDLWSLIQKGEDVINRRYTGPEKDDYYRYVSKYNASAIPESVREMKIAAESWTVSFAVEKNCVLLFDSWEGRLISNDDFNIVKRFARVFEQAYTRFLDLQKAESQARESQIQLALERVRARTMAMQKSEELSETSYVLFQQLKELGENSDQTTIGIFDEADAAITMYSTTHGSQWAHAAKIPLSKHSVYQQMYSGWKNNFKSLVIDIAGEELEALNKSKLENPDYQVSADDLPGDRWIINNAFFSKGTMAVCTTTPRSAESIQLFERFAQVFDHTYRRFLDLQKAEAQARESQIQLALERVRARTMAMQRSEELAEVATVLFQQVRALGIPQWTCGFSIFEIDDKEFTWYPGGPNGEILPPTKIPLTEHPIFIQFNESRKRGDELYIYEKTGEVQADHYRYMCSLPVIGEYLQSRLDAGEKFPEFQIDHLANFSHGNLIFITYEHFPEMHDIFKRFAKVFEQTYTRFLDLQKAEAQAREAQIEAALEKVRSRSLAMHKSDELQEVVHTVFEKLKELNVDFYTVIIVIFQEGSKDIIWWMENKINQQYPKILVRYADNPYLIDLFNAKENGRELFSICYYGEAKSKLYNYLLQDTDLKHVAANQKKFLLENEFAGISVAIAKNTGIHITSYSKQSFSEEENEILKRFAKVFEQAYIRFMDLQKAEAQAKEAKIEAALERVRSRSLAMHKSDELQDVVATVFERMKELEIEMDTSSIIVPAKNENEIEYWFTNAEGYLTGFHLPCFDNLVASDVFNARRKGIELLSHSYSFEEKNEFWSYLIEHTDFKRLPESRKKFILDAEAFTISIAFSKNTGIQINRYYKKSFSESENEVLKRFSRVFEQAYTRFLDLQKAEAQAREAQVEAALERVRARTMAMHSSEDVSVATATMFIELEKLGIENFRGGILNIRENKTMDVWSVNKSADSDPNDPVGRGKTIRAAGQWDMTLHPWWRQLYNGWINKDEFLNYFLTGKEREDYVKILDARRDYIPGGVRELPDCHIQAYYFGEGAVWTFSLQRHSDEDKQVMKKFASVFSLTFRRYQDLKNAEAQAREAQIELGLERVRARAMAMQTSDELGELVAILFEELTKLDLILARCIIWIFDTYTHAARMWMANSEDKRIAKSYFIKQLQHPYYDAILSGWKERTPRWVYDLKGENKKTIDQLLLNETELSQLPEPVKAGILSSEETFVAGSFNNFGLIEASGPVNPNNEQLDILNRFGKVFDLSYTRFNDLKKAEAQAKEAIKQATLDRIRADIASMRTVADLDKITPLIWNELNILGIPFIRCGVFIMDETQRLIHTFLSAPDGKAIAAFHLPYDTSGNLSKVLSHWKDNEKYIDHWDQSAFTELADILVKQGAVASPDQYLASIPHGGFYLHFLPFLQGMLYVGSLTQLGDEEIRLLQSVADAFSTAYARYEDFNKLEAAKQVVEKTLVDLKQAQQQLVQSEKMASLGELTAGIAHEIQNPLNFVNNFSDVSKELLDEMKAELATGNVQQAAEIADDVIENLEKILNHGKRADGIVKGMLQHSRSSSGQKELTDINALTDEYLRLAYHGLRAKDKSFNAKFETDFDTGIGKIEVVPQEIGRVILNLINNAFYAVNEKKKLSDADYEPTVIISTSKSDDKIQIQVKDNGTGIPQKVLDKIFQPFFTTKPTGLGTGLGLSLAYDIVKGHCGELKVETKEGEGSAFFILLSQ